MSFLGGEAEVVRHLIGPGCCVLDIGAHHGAFTVFALELGAEVISIEPHSSNLVQLRSATSNWRESCEVVPVAIGREDGFCDLEVPGGETSGCYVVEGTSFPVLGWNQLRTLYPNVNLMKMDIEGEEYSLFPPCDISWIPAFVIETHDWTVPGEKHREGVGMRESGPPRDPQAYERLVCTLAETHQLQIHGGPCGGFIVGTK